jgi:hypothetical protein
MGDLSDVVEKLTETVAESTHQFLSVSYEVYAMGLLMFFGVRTLGQGVWGVCVVRVYMT